MINRFKSQAETWDTVSICFYCFTVTEKPSFWDKFDKNFDKVVANVAYKDVSQVKDVSEKIKKFYFGDKKPSKDTLDNFVDVSIESIDSIKQWKIISFLHTIRLNFYDQNYTVTTSIY